MEKIKEETELSASKDIADINRANALNYVVRLDDIHLLKEYIHINKIDVNAFSNYERKSLLHIAVCKESVVTVKWLLDNFDIDVNQLNAQGDAALHIALLVGNIDITNLLIENKKIDINRRNSNGKTPLHSAVSSCNCDVVKHLLDVGADVNVKSNDGLTPFLLAKLLGPDYESIAEVLLQHVL